MPSLPESGIWPHTPSLQQLSVAFAVVAFIAAVIRGRSKGSPHSLDKLIAKLLAGSAIPTGLFLIVCAFDTSLISKLTDLSLYLAAAGLALLYVSIKEISDGW